MAGSPSERAPDGFERTLRQDELRADRASAPTPASAPAPAARAADSGGGDDMFADLYLDFDDLAPPPVGPPARDAAHARESGPPGRPAPHPAETTVPSIRALPEPGPPAPPAVPPPPGPVAVPPATAEPEGDVEVTSRTDSVARRREEDLRAAGADVEVQASAWSAASHPGRRRAARRERLGLGPELTARDNDDRYAATGSVFVVADGLGGHPSGWYAADVACRTLVADLAAADLSAGWSDRLRAAIAVADLAVRRHGQGQTYEGMRTTVVAAVIQDGRLHLAGCGDSVCWLVRGGAAFRLTEQGNAAEIGRPWLLTSTPLGGSQQPDPELQRIELHPGDRVVLATDGVGHLPDETVADLIHGDPFHAATTLTVTAVQSGDDDATAVVIECEALPVAVSAAALPRRGQDGPEDSQGDG
ncbi:PP2C family protein-serine/threonine phosphatase [Yinghuangia seranimata]|uniref:PP2C family protein-serine/threonine phosphatase n=1 Tax=Yinghuangia seranimata TaxID=408067 RepID=UPI00248B3D49|nr:PP2C family serine/threonine-protein phosphatase [Yinghuangia seranimata]MDI2129335.1 serine/threonine-protein phosphatase [Yinghuangia seranimata]